MQGRFTLGLILLALPFLAFATKWLTPAPIGIEQSISHSTSDSETANTDQIRTELLIRLDLFVRAQHTLIKELGAYVDSLERTPNVLGAMSSLYRVQVLNATKSKLLISASGNFQRSSNPAPVEIAQDRVTIDESFKVRANFKIGDPPQEYLKTVAQVTMNKIFSNHFQLPSRKELDHWEGVFRGYFKYEIRPVSQGGRTIIAVGLRKPVLNTFVEMKAGANLFQWVYENRQTQWAKYEVQNELEKIYFAQKIHEEHVGSYAPTFQSLLANWQSLVSLKSPLESLEIQELQIDPTFGFNAEIETKSISSSEKTRSPSSVKTWAVNGLGQVSEISSVPLKGVIEQFEHTRKKVSGEMKENFVPSSSDELKKVRERKPLLIDAIEAEK